jgi:hypothetical protein
MKTMPVDIRSERGIALIVVLLLMAVLSGLATGFAMNGKVESSMALNETYYAGTRAAAEAGINRATAAIRLVKDIHLLTGEDGVAGTADDGDLGFLMTGASPYPLGDPTDSYSYTVQVIDDDDPVFFPGLSADQLDAMCNDVPVPCTEDGNGSTDKNNRLILRATGFGPSNTQVTVSRMILPEIIPIPGSMVNPAILVDGDVEVDGNIGLLSTTGNGSIHSNGDMTISGNSATIQGDATASGELTVTSNNLEVEGEMGGGYSSINVPTKRAADYMAIADYKLLANGSVFRVSTNSTVCAAPCLTGWGGWTSTAPLLGGERTWTVSGNTVTEGSFYIEGKVSISGSPKGPGNSALAVSLLATSSISVTGNPQFKPDASGNPEKVLFVTDGDLHLQGTGLYDYTNVEGQIFVAEQIHTQGSWQFRGRIIVQNDTSTHNEVTSNSIGGTPDVTYNGTLPGYEIPPTLDYTYNITGWIEQ